MIEKEPPDPEREIESPRELDPGWKVVEESDITNYTSIDAEAELIKYMEQESKNGE